MYRTKDGMGDAGPMSMAFIPIRDEKGELVKIEEEHDARPRVGVAMRVGSMMARSFYHQDWWQTTPITEITDEWEDTDEFGEVTKCVRFKTGNSTYVWKEF
jgi:hypothetical protein